MFGQEGGEHETFVVGESNKSTGRALIAPGG